MKEIKMGLLTACFIGRFQPFHIGHYFALLQIAVSPCVGMVKIIIGSAEKNCPFNLSLRKKFFEDIILPKPFKLYSIKDSGFNGDPKDDIRWIKKLESCVAHFDIGYGNEEVRRALKKAGYKVGHFQKLTSVSGTYIRQLLLQQDKQWQNIVLANVSKLINANRKFWCKNLMQ